MRPVDVYRQLRAIIGLAGLVRMTAVVRRTVDGGYAFTSVLFSHRLPRASYIVKPIARLLGVPVRNY